MRALIVCWLGATSIAVAEPTDAPPESATSAHLDREDLEDRPHMWPSDLLRHVPGLSAIRHAGGGRADELLLRGYAAGQGAEVAVFVDGVPVNLVTHAQTHGYADMHFVIPETIGAIDLHVGPYAARFGELATAGTLELETIDAVPRGHTEVNIASGSELTGPVSSKARLRRLLYRLVGMTSPKLEHGNALLAVQVGISDGAFINPQRFRRGAVLGKWTRPVAGGELAAAVTVYGARWAESGLIPLGEVEAGHLGEFSAADSTQGGIATRASASLGYSTQDSRGDSWRISGYVVDSSHHLYTNSTLYLRDQERGDQLETIDRRAMYGLTAAYHRNHKLFGMRGRLVMGVQTRADNIEAQIWHTQRHTRLVECFEVANPCSNTAPRVREFAAYVEDVLAIGSRVRLETGMRLSELLWDVDDLDPETTTTTNSLTGTGARARLSPKLGVVYLAGDAVELSARLGGGAHTTDARAAVAGSTYGAFVRTWTGELGVLARPSHQLLAAAAIWASRVEPQLEWRHELDTAELVPATRRHGIEARVEAELFPWLALDASFGIARGHSTEGPIALAPRLIASGGVSIHRDASQASVRVRGLGPRATAVEDLETQGYVVVDAVARHSFGRLGLELAIDNLLDTKWRESEQAGPIRVSRRVEAVDDLLFTPGVPLTVMVLGSYAW